MNSNKRDIYFKGRIYVDVDIEDFFPMGEFKDRLTSLTSYQVQGSHSFTDGMNVTGRYELERRGTTSKLFDKTFAIPTPAPVAEYNCQHESLTDTGMGYYHCPDCNKNWTKDEWKSKPVAELPKEAALTAKELVEKFARYADCNHYEYLGAGRVEIQTSEEKKIKSAKQCALISNQREIDLINRLLDTNLNNDFDLLRERGELMDVQKAINQI